MNTKILVDSIMRQTTVLIAQLTTSAGIRAPMARLADEVFLTLSEELEAEGLSRKVVADMFGMALRGYQRRVQRLKEGTTDSERTLWESVLTYIESDGPVRRQEVLSRFVRDDPNAVRSILQDLIKSGLVLHQGSGANTRLVALPDEERGMLAKKGSKELVRTMVWLHLSHHPDSTGAEIAESLNFSPLDVDEALKQLAAEGEVEQRGDKLRAQSIFIAPGASAGWETGVFDHFQAVCAALITKLRNRDIPDTGELTGGSTMTFDLYDGHPEEQRVKALLGDIRTRINEVWAAVEARNHERPIEPEELQQLTFYFGQYVRQTEEETS